MRCPVLNCGRPLHAAGLCSRHYNRRRVSGTVEDGPRAKLSLEQRFWRQVDKRGPDDCWEWKSASRIAGYGVISLGGRAAGKILAHRLSWQLHHGELPNIEGHHGAVIRHTCDNRLCCNPKHLLAGTQSENVRDMDVKGRRVTATRSGTEHHNAAFVDDDIRAILASRLSNAELGRQYGVERSTIRSIRLRKTWRHVK